MSIPYATSCRVPVYIFDKLDGSNIRAEWNKKRGWFKFGSRTRLLDETDPVLGKAPALILEKYGDQLAKSLSDNGFDKVICFFEFYGPNSFAGIHDLTERQTVTLFDVAPFNQGILEPASFVKMFGHLDIPNILHVGSVTDDIIKQVRNSTLPGMTFEGIVGKGRNDKKTKMPIMFKQKSDRWLERLRGHCKNNDSLFESLK